MRAMTSDRSRGGAAVGRDGPTTAAELMRQLAQDPEYAARAEETARRTERARAVYQAASRPLLDELAAAGHPVDTVGQLVTGATGTRYPAAIPVLLRWLPRVDYRPLLDDIVRALSVPWAKRDAAKPLVAFFRDLPAHDGPPETDPRWTVGNALEVLASPAIADDLLELATDRRYGRARQLVVLGLGRLKGDERVPPVLLDLLDDEDVAGYAVMALGKLKESRAAPRLRTLLDHPQPWVRREAAKALRRIG